MHFLCEEGGFCSSDKQGSIRSAVCLSRAVHDIDHAGEHRVQLKHHLSHAADVLHNVFANS